MILSMTSWGHFGDILQTSWGHPGPLWDHFGITLGPLWHHSGITLRDHLGYSVFLEFYQVFFKFFEFL